jgi:hypothetical protein
VALDHATHVRLDLDDLSRWAAVARQLEPVTPAVYAEVQDLHRNPCPPRFARCVAAARFAAAIASEPLKTVAIALAEDFERRVAGH